MITDSGREERTTKRVALYARVSTVNHGQDPEVQLRELREFCQRRGFQIIEEFADRGISGSRERRPAVDQLMAICRKRLVDAVVVYRYDRPTGPSKTPIPHAFTKSLSSSVHTLLWLVQIWMASQ